MSAKKLPPTTRSAQPAVSKRSGAVDASRSVNPEPNGVTSPATKIQFAIRIDADDADCVKKLATENNSQVAVELRRLFKIGLEEEMGPGHPSSSQVLAAVEELAVAVEALARRVEARPPCACCKRDLAPPEPRASGSSRTAKNSNRRSK